MGPGTNATHTWIGTFAACMIEARPNLSFGGAVQRAVLSYHYARELDPRGAAGIYLGLTAPVVGDAAPDPQT